MRRLAQLLARVRQVHVVELGRALQPVEVVAGGGRRRCRARSRRRGCPRRRRSRSAARASARAPWRPPTGRVSPFIQMRSACCIARPFRRPRRARQARRSPPGSSRRCPPRSPPRWPEARSGVRSPCSSTRSTADSTAAAASSMRASGAASAPPSRTSRAGSRLPGPRCRAPSRAPARNRPGPARPRGWPRQQADRAGDHRGLVGEDVAEHVLGEEHVEVGGARDQLHRGVVDEHVLELRRPGSRRATRSTVSRHRREVSRMLALSTETTCAAPRRARPAMPNASSAIRSISATE